MTLKRLLPQEKPRKKPKDVPKKQWRADTNYYSQCLTTSKLPYRRYLVILN